VVTIPPTQVVLALGVGAITRPLGNVSTSGAVRVSGMLLVLLNVIVMVETPPLFTLDGLKDFLSVGAASGVTSNSALALVALLPLVVCNAPTGRVLT